MPNPNWFFDLQLILVRGQNRQCNCSEEIDGGAGTFLSNVVSTRYRKSPKYAGQLLLRVPSGVTFEVPGVANGSFDPLRLLALQGALEKSGFAYHWDLLLSKRKATS